MNSYIRDALYIALIGCGGTMVLDIWTLVLRRLNIPTLNYAYIGRWIGHIFQGKWFHASIRASQPVNGEAFLGWLAHYAIGVCFAALLALIAGVQWIHNPTIAPAIIIGIATAIAPLFIMQPAIGVGIASRNTPRPLLNSVKSLTNHLVFGIGLYLSGLALVHLT